MRSSRPGLHSEFKPILDNLVRPYSKIKIKVRHGDTSQSFLHLREEWRQGEQKFETSLGYTSTWKRTWATCL